MQLVLQNIVRLVLLILLQVLVLNNVAFLGFVNPYLYILFVIMLPVKLTRWATLVLAFGCGLLMDTFSNTGGMHTASLLLIAFLRNGIIGLFITIEEGNNPTPTFYTFGLNAYIKYVVMMVVIYHLAFFVIEASSLAHPLMLITKIIMSSVVTIFIIMGIQMIKIR
jgi:rod shape-determining protein MreD